MPVNFRKATRQGTHLMIGIAGPSGAGKTYSALLMADGIRAETGKPVFGIDTESGRMLHYADRFEFQYAGLEAPFSPERYLEAIQSAEQAGAGVIIVDSMSHEHEGPGGILEQHEAELTRMAGTDHGKRERMKFSAWIKPKRSHNLFVNAVLQVRAHLIFCFRAKDKLVLVKNDKGKQEPTSIGWTPIIPDRFDYEMVANVMLPPGARGVPDLSAQSTKIPEPLEGLFRRDRAIDRETGRRLAKWAAGGEAQPNGVDKAALLYAGIASAKHGRDSMIEWWKGLTTHERAAMEPHLGELKSHYPKEQATDEQPRQEERQPEPADA